MSVYIRRAQRPDRIGPAMRFAQRGAAATGSVVRIAASPLRRYGFPYRKPTVPRRVTVPRSPSKLGPNYDTSWARRPLAKVARTAIVNGPVRGLVRVIARPEVLGLDRLAHLTRLDEPPAVIFAPNHHSHLDTGVMLDAVPACWRHELVVAAAADYFFDQQWKATMSALALNAIPIDREVTNRATADQLRDLVADGHSLIIYPEGGRSPDGWGQEFKGGAAYLAGRTGAPVVPVFIDGTGAIFGKGMKRPKPGRSRVIFGSPLTPADGESTRSFNRRIEAAVTRLGDEALTDYWTALRRSATSENPSLTGPEHNGWRRQWAIEPHRSMGAAGLRRRPTRRWP